MNIKLSDLLEVEKPLGELLTQELPIKIAYHLGKLVKKVGSELKQFYLYRDNLIKKYGSESAENKGEWSISPEDKDNIEKFQNEIQELVDVEVELYNFNPISINEFNGTNTKLTAIQMSSLEAFFTE